jgi:hypothetical protein
MPIHRSSNNQGTQGCNIIANNVARALVVGLPLVTFCAPVAAQSAPNPARGLEKHCSDIRMVFEAVKFNGDYRKRADAYVKGGCAGEVPLPSLRDPHNVQRFNAAAGILQNGGGIHLTD